MTTNTTSIRLTKRDHFNTLLNIPAVAENDVLVEFINHELELLARKNSTERKPSAKQMENDSFRTQILSEMEAGQKYTISDMIKTFPCCAGESSQRLSGLFRTMIDKAFPENPTCPLIRVEEKRKAYFMLNPDYQG